MFLCKRKAAKNNLYEYKIFFICVVLQSITCIISLFMAAITASGSIVNNSFRDIIMSPEGAVRFYWGRDVGLYRCPRGAEGVSEHIHDGINAYVSATKKWQSVARGCRAELLGNDIGL